MRTLDWWYSVAYRLPTTPWERASRATTSSTGVLLDREESQRPRPLGRALDLGCGRGFHSAELARRGWETVGVDLVPRAIGAAIRRDAPGARFMVGDVTNLGAVDLGTFDFFLDVGCIQGLDGEQRLAVGEGVTRLANPGATLLVLAFQPTRFRAATGALSKAELQAAFPGWEPLSVEAADTAGLGWPLTLTAPQWLRFRVLADGGSPTAGGPGRGEGF